MVFFNTLSGTEAYAVMERVDYCAGLLFAAATIPGAVLGALSTAYVPRKLFDIIFGILLLAVSVFLLLFTRQANFENYELDLLQNYE